MTRWRTGFPYLDDTGTVTPFAHRGGAYHPEIEGLENTLAAFRHAVALGYRYLETDVHATRDGVLLAFHDTVLDRVTDRKGEIASLDHAEVRQALIGGRERVPTLAQLFDEFPEARFNIDLKSPAAVRPLADFIEERQVADRVMVGSFSASSLREFRELTRGRVATSAHPLEVAIWVLAPTGALARRLTGGHVAALQVPHRRHGIRVTNRWLLHKAHSAGVPVHVWTIDDPAEMNDLIDMGVDALMTDRTDTLKDVLIARRLWEGPE